LGAPVGTDDFIRAHMAEVIESSGTRALATHLSEMEDKQVAWLLNSWSLSSRLGYLVRVTPPHLARSTMEQADNTSLWTLERIMEIADATEGTDFFEGGCNSRSLRLETHQQVQAQMPTSAGGLGLSSMKHRQHAAFVGSLVATLPTLLARQQGPHGESFSQAVRTSPTIKALGVSIHTLLSTGVPLEDLTEIIGQDWVTWGGTAPPAPTPEVHILAAHDARITRRAQHEITRLLNRI
ncbi:unnamed protein product, partial [Choristocarpus tenellus]